jgi:two-component system chemotaxis response regulator CheB
MAYFPVPILVVTSRGDVDTAYKAISRGALEVVPKPEVTPDSPKEFINKIKLLAKVRVISHPLGKKNKRLRGACLPAISDNITPLKKAIAIASSTGGPKALCRLLSQLPENFPSPIFISQHIPQDFVNGMVEWLGEHSKLKVKEGENEEFIRAGTIYISPSQYHMTVNSYKKIQLNPTMPDDIYFPSCDTLLSSVADVYGKHSIGIVLTGMGNDGTKGIAKIKSVGGTTIAQDESSSVVFGMPDSAIKSGNIDMILSIDAVCEEIIKLIQ